jgi:hypothetical protein
MRISPTQVTKFRRCQRIIGFEYVEGIKAPPSPKQKFGSDVHAFLEDWLAHGVLPDDSPEGRVAKQGIDKAWLPMPDRRLLVEHEFQYPMRRELDMFGFVDCAVPPDISDPPLVIDHKTTSDLRWAKTADQLAADEQALIYATWGMLKWQVPVVRARWIYYAASNPQGGTRKPRGAKPVEVTFDCRTELFAAKLKKLEEDVLALARIRRSRIRGLDLPASPGSCGMFGGCFYQDRCALTGGDRLAAYMEKDKVT